MDKWINHCYIADIKFILFSNNDNKTILIIERRHAINNLFIDDAKMSLNRSFPYIGLANILCGRLWFATKSAELPGNDSIVLL